jgi:hypothetical protein
MSVEFENKYKVYSKESIYTSFHDDHEYISDGLSGDELINMAKNLCEIEVSIHDLFVSRKIKNCLKKILTGNLDEKANEIYKLYRNEFDFERKELISSLYSKKEILKAVDNVVLNIFNKAGIFNYDIQKILNGNIKEITEAFGDEILNNLEFEKYYDDLSRESIYISFQNNYKYISDELSGDILIRMVEKICKTGFSISDLFTSKKLKKCLRMKLVEVLDNKTDKIYKLYKYSFDVRKKELITSLYSKKEILESVNNVVLNIFDKVGIFNYDIQEILNGNIKEITEAFGDEILDDLDEENDHK